MRRLSSLIVALALTGCYATVSEDGRPTRGEAAFSLTLPSALSLVVVEPGVSVVRDYDDEVFFADGYYWVRQDRSWYRTRDHHAGWSRVDAGRVPPTIVRSPPGRYRHYRGDDHQRNDVGQGRPDGRGRDDG